MGAELLLDERQIALEDGFVELVLWRVEKPLKGSRHSYKYRLAFVVEGRCIARFDNEHGHGDHFHRGDARLPYAFVSPKRLLEDFWREVDEWRSL